MLTRTDRRRFPVLLAVIAVLALAMPMLFSPVQAQEGSEPPAEPTGLEATATHDSVTLTWDDPGDDTITGYVILRRIPGVDLEGQFDELVSDTGTDATTYTDDTVAAETRYTYRIKAINEHGTSERSRWSHIDTPAAPEAAEGDDPDGEDDGGAPGGPGQRANVSEPSGEDCPEANNTTCEVDVGGSATGNIGTDLDEDRFAVVLEAGKRYQIDLEGQATSRGTQPNPILDFHSVSTFIEQDDDDGVGDNARLVYTPTVAGTYYIDAATADDAQGTYTLSVIVLGANGASEADTDFPATTATSGRVEVGASATGNSENEDDEDWFKVVLEAGKIYQIDLKGEGGGGGTQLDPSLYAIRDSSGTAIADTGNDDADPDNDINDSQFIFTPATAGAYYLVPGGGNSSGTYTLSVRDVTFSTDATLSALSLGTGVTLSPTFASDTYAYTVSVANSVDEVTVTLEKSDSDATVEYLDSSDAALPDEDSTSEGHQVTLVVGNTVIKVKVTAEDGTTTQTYTVTVTLAEGSLVSNIGQGSTETHLTTTARSQRFRAGSNEAGYILTGVDVVSGGTHSFTAKVCGVASNNNPTSTCTDLTPQGSFAAGTMSFSAPPNITLSKGTTYAVVLTPVGSFMNYGRTTSEREDKGKQPGSSIANEFEYFTSQTSIWTENSAFSVRIAIKGTLAGGDTPPACTLNDGDIWCGVVDVGAIVSGGTTVGHGFSGTTGDIDGNPEDKEFTVPSTNNSYTITSLLVGSGRLVISLDDTLSEAAADNDRATLELGIDGVSDPFPLSNSFQSGTGYRWDETGLDWSMKATVTVRLREEDPPTLSVADATGAEGDDKVVFTVTLSKPRSGESRATWTASIESGDTAVAADLGTTKTGTVAIAAGATTATFEVPVVDDATDEDDETFTVTLSSPYPSADVKLAADATATGTIEDDDATVTLPTLSVADAEGDEDDGVEFTATLTTAVSAKVTATWTASIESGDTASAADLAATKTGEVEFDADATEAKFTVPLTDDTTDEPEQTFTVTLSGVSSNAQLATDPTAEGTIDDDDDPPTLTVADVRHDEGNSESRTIVTVSISEVSEKRVRFKLRPVDRTEDTASDADWNPLYSSPPFNVITAGTMSRSRFAGVVINRNDTLDEDDETLTVEAYSLENAQGSSSDREATITIVDDDPTPTVTVADAAATEGDKVEFVVTLSAVSGRDVEVGYATSVATGQTATSDTDFTAASGTLTILASDSTDTGTVEVQTTEDDASESAETFTLTLSATKNVALGTPSTATGTINDDATDDCLADTDTTCEVDVGGSVTGNIETEDDEDWFKVVLEADKTYQIDMRGEYGGGGTLEDPLLDNIRDSSGTGISDTGNDDVDADNDNYDSRTTFTPTTAGAYYLVATTAADSGTYTLSVREIPCTLNDGDIWCGVVTVEEVKSGEDLLAHGFADTTSPATLDAGSLAGNPEDRTFSVGDNEYTVQAVNVGTGSARDGKLGFWITDVDWLDVHDEGILVLTIDGVATPRAFDGAQGLLGGLYSWDTDLDWSSTPEVTVRLQTPDDFSAGTTTTGEVDVGGSVTGNIETVADYGDWFKVELEADTRYQIDLEGADTGRGTLVDPGIELLADSSGNTVPNTGGSDSGVGKNDRTIYTPSTSDAYYVVVQPSDTGLGTYTLSVIVLGANGASEADTDFPSTTATTGRVDVGASATGNISTSGDTDFFRVELEAGKEYQFDLEGAATTRGTLSDPYLGLYDGSVSLIATNDDIDSNTNPNSQIVYTATATGAHYLAASGRSGSMGTYTLSVRDVTPESDDCPGDTTTTCEVDVGGSVTGNITSDLDNDWFRVDLKAGTRYQIDLEGMPTAQGTLPDPVVEIRDADNTLDSEADDDGGVDRNARLIYTPDADGTYYLVARLAGSTGGTYTVSVIVLGANGASEADTDFPNSNTTTGRVEVGASVTGNIVSFGDDDWFRVDLEAGKVYQFDLEGADTSRGTLSNPYLTLNDRSGTNVDNNDDNNTTNLNSLLTYTATATGAHYLGARGSGGVTGTYTLSVREQETRTAEAGTDFADDITTLGMVEVGGSATGDIDPTGDQDWFRVVLEAGKKYQIDLEGSFGGGGTLVDPFLSLYDGSGSRLTTDDDGGTGLLDSQLVYTATATGAYYLGAKSSSAPVVTGTYTLSVRDVTVSTDATLSALSLGTGVTLSPTFASDTYAYTASVANDITAVTVTTTTNHGEADVEYLDSSDTALADADTNTAGQQVNLDVGDTVFKVKVTAEDGTTTQDYTVTVTRAACVLETGDYWCGVVTVGDIMASGSLWAHGYINVTGATGGTFVGETDISVGSNDYTFTGIYVPVSGSFDGDLIFRMDADFTSSEKETLELHIDVDGTGSTWPMSEFTDSTNEGQMIREEAELDWSSATTVTARLREFQRPTVTNVAVTSMPALETDTYGAGETIEVSVTFSEAVNATSDTDFVLSVAGAKRAPLLRGSDTATLVFGYTVLSSDEDTNGIWIGDETRTLDGNRNGVPQAGTITSVATGAAADLDHTDLGTLSDHKVDGSRTTANVAPSFSSSATISVAENQTTVVTVVATDSDTDDDITGYEITGGADQTFFSIGATSGALTFDAAPNYEDADDSGTNNTYVVEVTATSGTGTRVEDRGRRRSR